MSKTTLEDFLSKFGSAEGKYVDQIDPLNTFEIKFSFQPNGKKKKKNKDSGIISSIKKAAQSATKNLANNLTGGLLGSILNDVKVMKKKEEFDKIGKQTFLEYLAGAQLLVNQESWIGENAGVQSETPLELNLGLYVQNITVPKIQQSGGSDIEYFGGKYKTAGISVGPDNNTLIMDIINTKLPLFERIFYPWMKEVTLPFWSYDSQPYTTATITIDFSKHADFKYVFLGCRPTLINTIQPSQDASDGELTRQVSFDFDFMYVSSKLEVIESAEDKLKSTLVSLGGAAGEMLNF